MTITVEDNAPLALAEAAMKALEEIKARVAAMGGEACNPITIYQGQKPRIQVYKDRVYISLDIKFDATALSQCTPQSGGQTGCNP